MKTVAQHYYKLIKPGIVYGNAMTALAAFLFATHHIAGASTGHAFDFQLLAAMLVGLSLSIAGACVVNNVIDRDIDPRMARTKDRAIPNGVISVRSALVYAAILLLLGFGLLLFFTNLYALGATLFGVIVYVALYTPAKRMTRHSTLIGAFAGAVPPVVGYAAVAHTFDISALLLFFILVVWQMTHFFAIAIFRQDDYARAGLPVMPVSSTLLRTKIHMLIYAVLFEYLVLLLGHVNQLSLWSYLIPMSTLSIAWVLLCLVGFTHRGVGEDGTRAQLRWARMTFFYSLILLVAFSVSLAVA